MKNKAVAITMIMVVTFVLLGAVGWVVVKQMSPKAEAKEPSIEEVLSYSVDVPEMTTNLSSNDFIRISFKIQTDGKKAKEELQQRDFMVNNIIIEELSELNATDLKGKKGKELIETTIRKRVDSLMQEGSVEKVYITSMMIQ
ncbi:flagellar basal body-associated protein FliL [Rossellomorea marisflavi]|nr:flagellar basal body-associated protein FliL [Rossellomorea marisflavi]MCM2604608.1 flagellar basal body-associated protein FliL [Rossellomorea marisflavi]QHA38435.1 flagellar basal body-associated protein FliL [Rossellomorea marisflavi]TYO73578.1 flagellar basal body-associated protein FliL [Rossellomorea marisflavi]USK94403.1 flagellar basal body-associated protein FliL [Rossellomorea marisflavi]